MCRISVILHLVFFVVAAYGRKWGGPLKEELNTKIAGGYDIDVKEFPYIASVEIHISDSNTLYYAGSLISLKHILTAAHCVFYNNVPVDPENIAILLGRNIANFYKVNQVFSHPDFNSSKMIPENDIAVLELEEKISQSDSLYPRPVFLRQTLQNKEETVRIVGWGVTKENGKEQDVLQTTIVPIVSRKYCNRVYATLANPLSILGSLLGTEQKIITENMFCAGRVFGGKGGCYGDDGGPAVSTRTGELMGVFIASRGCGRYPSVYINVTDYIDFIVSATDGDLATLTP